MPFRALLRRFASACGRRPRFILQAGAVLLAALPGITSLRAGVPPNLGPGLRDLTRDYRAARSPGAGTLSHDQFTGVVANYPLARVDGTDRVMVNVYLDGSAPIEKVAADAVALGCTITARVDWYRQGALSMYLPVNKAAKLGRTRGVNSVLLDLPPVHRVGKATSQGSTVLKAANVNMLGYLGAGVTVGVLSDSFDTAKLYTSNPPTTNATQDAANDDLPGKGSASNPTPVNVLEDFGGSTAATQGTDEGRAMLQIVHDLAPKSNLAFATADVSEVGFAQNIMALATPTNQTVSIPTSQYSLPAGPEGGFGSTTVNGAGCQVVCDDVGYFDEPMFSDGIVAQAVDTVSRTYGVSYFSSAGNDGNSGYAATYSAQPDNAASQALLASQGSITYANIPSSETGVIESFHSFGTDTGGNPILVQKVLVPPSTGTGVPGRLIFQWDDPFSRVVNSVNQLTTDYDILVFSLSTSGGTTTATYQPANSGTSSNFGTNVPCEIPSTLLAAGTQYEFVIARTSRPPGAGVTANQAKHIRWVVNTDAAQIVADFNTPNSPNSYGHDCAATCNGTAAYIYDIGFNAADSPYVPAVESSSSNGPSKIYFDAAGNRLASPVTRKQPVLAAVDGVDTSFFGNDTDGDGLPNFFGTSAAAPHGAGCAALLLNAAAVNGIVLAPADVRELLTSTTQGQQDLDPAVSGAAAGPVTFTALSRSTATDADAYTIAYGGPAGSTLTSLAFDLTPTGYLFFANAYAITPGPTTGTGTAPTVTSSALSNDYPGSTTIGSTETLNFANFNPGDTLAFGVAIATTGGDVVGGDALAGATFTATVTNADATTSTYNGTLANKLGRRWNLKSGFGLVDVNAAVARLLGH